MWSEVTPGLEEVLFVVLDFGFGALVSPWFQAFRLLDGFVIENMPIVGVDAVLEFSEEVHLVVLCIWVT